MKCITASEKIDYISLWSKERHLFLSFIEWMDHYEKHKNEKHKNEKHKNEKDVSSKKQRVKRNGR